MPQGSAYATHEIDEHLIRSRVVAETFRIRVRLPISRLDGSERFPVLYLTDADELFAALATLATALEFTGEIPRIVLVGVGYENFRAAEILRMRDLVPAAVRRLYRTAIARTARSPLVRGIDDPESVLGSSDAREFLTFIRTELKPFITARYPVIADDASFFGYSAGGTFGLYTLFEQPDTFRRYVLGSPGCSYGGRHFGIELGKSFLSRGATISARVFLSVGELEEDNAWFRQFELVRGYHQLVEWLAESSIAGLDLTTQVFPGESHATAWSLAFSRGLKAVYGPADGTPFWVD